ncbi:complex I subunit 5 family protein [Thermogladius sp. 4427co]|uniref:complex I subunit 5 family protein n=1 Tax=Thermogladius sp. 4427co TaxID=3450718 RepID=UPI003F78F2EA
MIWKVLTDVVSFSLAISGGVLYDSHPRLSRAVRVLGFTLPVVYVLLARGDLLWFQYYLTLIAAAIAVGVSLHSEDFYWIVYGQASYPLVVIDTSLVLLEIVFSSLNLIEMMAAWLSLDIILILLILLEKGVENYHVAVTYMILSMLPSDIALFTIWALLADKWGDYGGLMISLSEASSHPLSPGLLPSILILVGLTAKLAQVPLHIWLPIVHPEAPSHGSAILSGLVVKLGAFTLLVSMSIFNLPKAFYIVLLGQGILSSVYGFLAATAESDLKRLLAYSTIGHMGIITILAGLNGVLNLPNFSMLPLMVFYILYHAVTKTLAFLNTGLIEQIANTHNFYELGYIDALAPEFTLPALIASLSLTGLPPTAGFAAKISLVITVFQLALGYFSNGFSLGAVLILAAISLASILSVIYSVKLIASYVSNPSRRLVKHVVVGRMELLSEYYLASLLLLLPLVILGMVETPIFITALTYIPSPLLLYTAFLKRRVSTEEKPWFTGVEV